MKRRLVVFCVSVSLLLLSIPAAQAQRVDDQIGAVLRDKLLHKATVGIAISRLGDRADEVTPIYSHNQNNPLIPASNLKVVTTAAALDRLGADFQFKTRLYVHDGDLVLVGDGDPTFGDAEFLKQFGWNIDTVFQQWTTSEQMQRHGISSVRDVIVDDGIFDNQFVHPSWPADQLHKRYVAGVAGMNINANCIDFLIRSNGPGQVVSYAMAPDTSYVSVKNTCVGGGKNAVWITREPESNTIILKGESPTLEKPVSITVTDPSLLAATVLSDTLKRNGVSITGTVRRDTTARQQVAANAPGWRLIAQHSTPLHHVLARANKDSMNLYAESLCKRLGFESTSAPGSWASGTSAIEEYLHSAGAAPDGFKLDDGCGLSRQNRLAAGAIVKVLAHQFHNKNRQMFIDSMAIAGVDGTLDDRFKGSDLRGRVFAKSGFINHVSGLSGYLHAKDGNWYAFSILMNGIPHLSNSSIKPLQERIVRAVDQSTAVASR